MVEKTCMQQLHIVKFLKNRKKFALTYYLMTSNTVNFYVLSNMIWFWFITWELVVLRYAGCRGTTSLLPIGSFDQMEEVGELTIHEGGDSCDEELIQINKFTSDVEEAAIKLLASRALTALELRKKLLGKRFSPDEVEAVINKFQKRGFINDRLYAETFSQSRWTSSSWGPRRIKQALFKKGVSQADAEKAVEVVFKDNDCAEDLKSVIGLSKHSMDHLCTQASKQWFRGQNVPKETRKSRIVRWLQYRGFDWNVINFILKKLDRQDQNSP
ncbi:hypothetical protein D0Y65_005532 [Glycine soja]|uniref:Regulatory protein RecX n=1 Tax=Glycine soja TaxID=3848 RepID=A0A445LWA3_GLYSO|nr:hypothetical protein D0Y65_005532 [Glycine soja]